jgi:hypothetical protein
MPNNEKFPNQVAALEHKLTSLKDRIISGRSNLALLGTTKVKLRKNGGYKVCTQGNYRGLTLAMTRTLEDAEFVSDMYNLAQELLARGVV